MPKVLDKPMDFPSSYNPHDHESMIYELWEQSGAFLTKTAGKGDDYFSQVVPPPNANGDLHIGFGLTMAIEDTLARYHRLKGEPVLFVPGADHAGIETQVVYEKELAKKGLSRMDFSREDLYKQIWDFVAANRTNFEQQFRRLGVSVNWDRFVFTLDKKVVDQAYATFKHMWDEKLIYRGERLVNFCTFHDTAFSDIEVEHKEVDGSLWYVVYPLSSGEGEIRIATTRPETIFGDTAVAVNPGDKRYKDLIGKSVRVPLTERDVPIVADKAVDEDFGTGAVKVTPAHDYTDFDIGQRHQLPLTNVINHDGTLNHEAPEGVRGLKIAEARAKTVELLEEKGLLAKVEPHHHTIGVCYKCGTIIEPLLREQWFVDMKPLAEPAIKALENREIKFYPDSKRTQLIRYLEGLRDWNISRQNAWGIPIPAFRSVDDDQEWIFDERVNEQTIEVNGRVYERDPDVFDTWFSSGSWPYATLNFPGGEDYKNFYPLSLMETGGEILYPWVARMLMLGLYTTDQAPFKEVYIHGYVMAEDGSKMSKSVGNVVSAAEQIDRYGADALRMGLITGRVPGVNRPYDERRVEEARNFANKLWNVVRFSHLQSSKASTRDKETIADHWILNKLSLTIGGIQKELDNYQLAEAYERLYHFVWDDLADWFVEAVKAGGGSSKILAGVAQSALKLAHPFAPFVTEAIWQQIKAGDVLAGSTWPEGPEFDKKSAEDFEQLKNVVSRARQLSVEAGLQKPVLVYQDSQLLAGNSELVAKLANLSKVEEGQGGLNLNLGGLKAWLSADDAAIKAYTHKLESRLKEADGAIKQLESRLANRDYQAKAPKELVDETKALLAKSQELADQIKSELKSQ